MASSPVTENRFGYIAFVEKDSLFTHFMAMLFSIAWTRYFQLADIRFFRLFLEFL